ncbi:MAG TPA: phosphoenolpyruvate synthase [Alphaproteobacteria bacterium]|nr:phosphoenolpyruvate synthase [Alphaproteobacteria bacterium]
MSEDSTLVRSLSDLGRNDVGVVGGKNASLGEMLSRLSEHGITVPQGFATTAAAYWAFIEANDLGDRIAEQVGKLKSDRSNLHAVGTAIRDLIIGGEFSPALSQAIMRFYRDLGEAFGETDAAVAVRSSATAEDLPEASFAGQLETFLNVRGEEALLDACKRCFASLFTDRAIAYREDHGFDHLEIALSVGVQRMVRADQAGSGVMFSIDTETGFPRTVLINANWGLGETVVQGIVDPDEYHVFKPLLGTDDFKPIIEKRSGGKAKKMVYAEKGSSKLVDATKDERAAFVLSDDEVITLARWSVAIEEHYGQPMDMEWAKDGKNGELFIVQARPETVQSRKGSETLKSYSVRNPGKRLLTGTAIGDAVAVGKAHLLSNPEEGEDFPAGGILVAEQTDPDWVPLMQRAAAIVTDHGGRTSHAAIVSRELGLPAVIGAGEATTGLKDGQTVTVSCAEGDEGFVYEGAADVDVEEMDLRHIPETQTEIMLNLANPAAAFRWWRLPADGVGLARMEFVIGNAIKVHPMALAHFDQVEDKQARKRIEELTRGYPDKPEYFIDKLARGLARIAAAYHPQPVIVRLSDFKTNEYAELIGGRAFEPKESNPMLGWRGASRYYDEAYRDGFALECRAIKRAREEIGLTNIVVMVPFCRTVEEADLVLQTMADNGLLRGQAGLQIYVMAEIPANVILAEQFADRFDGFSIGSNDLTQLVLGVDRDSEKLKRLYDERNPAVNRMVSHLITEAHAKRTKVGFCGQAPSDHPNYAGFLVECGIDSISITPDSFLSVKRHVAAAEAERLTGKQ